MTTTRRATSPTRPTRASAKASGRTTAKPAGRAPSGSRKKAAARALDELVAADVMVTRVVTVTGDTPLREVERVLADNRISGVPVTDQDGCVLGVLSVRDLIEHHADEGRQPSRGPSFYQIDARDLDEDELDAFDLPEDPALTAEQMMTPQVLAVDRDTPLREVAAKMVHNNVHRLLVQHDERMVGLISSMDLLRAVAK